jgi:putative protease
MKRDIEILVPCNGKRAFSALLELDVGAIYLGLKGWSHAPRCLEVSLADLEEMADLCHQHSKRLLLSFNIVPSTPEWRMAANVVMDAVDRGVDGVICSEPSLVEKIVEMRPEVEVHVSVGSCVINLHDALFWKDLVVKRLIVSPHLGIAEVEELASALAPYNVETEVMIQGVRCIPTLLGICRMSSFFDMNIENEGLRSLIWSGSSKRSGICYKPCAQEWNDQDGHYWEMAPHAFEEVNLVPLYLQAGVGAFKIGGRGLSAEKVAALVDEMNRKMENVGVYV